MNGKVIAIAGAMGEGKTTFIKTRFASNCKKIMAYLRITDDFDDIKATVFTNFGEFIKVGNKKKDILLLIDEAFTCLPKNLNIKIGKPEDLHNLLADLLVNARKLNRFIVIIFHSLSQIPLWLVPYLDYLIRFNTNDQLQYQAQRFQSFPIIAENLKYKPRLEKFKPEKLKLR